MTELDLEGRIKRSQRRKAKQEKKRRERQAEAARQLATLILQRSVPPSLPKEKLPAIFPDLKKGKDK
jgi:hypothetical protein